MNKKCHQIAEEMLGIPLPKPLRWKLDSVASYVEKLGGKLVSRQVIASIITRCQEENERLRHSYD